MKDRQSINDYVTGLQLRGVNREKRNAATDHILATLDDGDDDALPEVFWSARFVAIDAVLVAGDKDDKVKLKEKFDKETEKVKKEKDDKIKRVK